MFVEVAIRWIDKLHTVLEHMVYAPSTIWTRVRTIREPSIDDTPRARHVGERCEVRLSLGAGVQGLKSVSVRFHPLSVHACYSGVQ